MKGDNKRAWFTIDGEPATLREIKRNTKRDNLQELTREYIIGKEAAAILGIGHAGLRKMREQGRVAAVQLDKVWYYSRRDLAHVINEKPQP